MEAGKVFSNAIMVISDMEKDVDTVLLSRDFLQYCDIEARVKQYDDITAKDLDAGTLLIFLHPEDIKDFDVNKFDKLMNLALSQPCNFLTLGDSNERVMKYFSFDSEVIKNHYLGEDEVHNIVTSDDTELYIPSRHRTTLTSHFFGKKSSDEIKSLSENFVDVLASSPKRDTLYSKDTTKKPFEEIEIFVSNTVDLLGIYGAPELFFRGGLDAGSNTTNAKTLGYLKRLIHKFYNFKYV